MDGQAHDTITVADHRIMLDSTSAKAIAAARKAGMTWRGLPPSLAGIYLDGLYKAPAADVAELHAAGFDGRSIVGITVSGQGAEAMKARANDSEPGNDNASEAAAWAKGEHDAAHWPVIYCDRARKPKVIDRCTARGLRLSADYGLWVATLDGTFTDLDGSDLRTAEGVVGIQFGQAQSPLHAAGQPPDLDVTLVVRASWRAPRAKTGTEYIVIRLPDGASSKMLSGMTLK